MQFFITNQTHHINYDEFKIVSLDKVIEYFKNRKFIQLDSETTGFDPHTESLLTLQLGSTEHQFVIDALTVDLSPLKSLLEDKSKIILIHNAKFDLKWLYKIGIIPFTNIYDTFLAERVLSTGLDLHKKSLSACVERYCDVILPKEVRSQINRLGIYNSKVLAYAANDVKYLEDIYHVQQKLLKEKELEKAISLDNLFVCVLAYTEYFGIKLDKKCWSDKAKADKDKLYIIKQELDNLVVEFSKFKKHTKYLQQPDLFNTEYTCGINWNSQQQVIPLFKELGLELSTVDKKTGQIKDSVESKIIKGQKDKHIIVEKYLQYQKAAKLVSTYGYSFLDHVNPVTHRIHSNFTQIMNTGRLSSGGSGTVNMQNIPAGKERECFTVEKRNVFVVSDYSAQEGRVLAEYANDPDYSEISLNPDKDLHSFSAKLLYPELEPLSVSEIKKNHSYKRQKAKSISFAIPYGGNGATIAQNLSLSIKQGEDIYNKFMNAFPGLKNYFNQVKKETIEQGYVLINKLTGRKSFFYNYDEYLNLKERLESYSNSINHPESFQGLSQTFWDYYGQQKSIESDIFLEMKALLSKYFKLKNTFERKGLNFPIQGSSAEMTKLAGIKFYQWILENNLWGKVFICAFVHDEIVTECPKNIANTVSKKLKQCMESAGKVFCPTIPIIAEPNIGEKWDH